MHTHLISQRNPKRFQYFVWIVLVLMLATIACVRTASTQEGVGGGEGVGTEAAAETKDAQVQMTLSALLSSATAENAQEPTFTPLPPTSTTTSTLESLQLTQLAAALTAEAAGPTATYTPQFGGPGTATPSPTITNTPAPCYAHRYVYDETYPDGSRLDPNEKFQKTWRLQNVGTCNWVAGQYELFFVSGAQMSGQSPITINYTVEANGYANFSVNLTAPSVPGTYRGEWILRTKTGELIGWGPQADQTFWVEIIVRGASPTP